MYFSHECMRFVVKYQCFKKNYKSNLLRVKQGLQNWNCTCDLHGISWYLSHTVLMLSSFWYLRSVGRCYLVSVFLTWHTRAVRKEQLISDVSIIKKNKLVVWRLSWETSVPQRDHEPRERSSWPPAWPGWGQTGRAANRGQKSPTLPGQFSATRRAYRQRRKG